MTTFEDVKKFGVTPWLDVGSGWHKLLCDMHDEIMTLTDKVSYVQIKEKFGTLRVYFSASQDVYEDVSKIVSKYERISEDVCETCGNQGELRSDTYWLKTLCDACSEARLERINQRERLEVQEAERAGEGSGGKVEG